MAEEKKEPVKIKCPCCGELTLTQPVDVKSVVLDEYMAAIIAGVPFSHTYGLHNGAVKVTVESLSREQSVLMSNVIKRLELYKKNGEPNSDYIHELCGVIRLYYGVTSIEMYRDKQLTKSYTPSEVMRSQAETLSKAFATGDHATICNAVAAAIKECLSEEAISPLHDAAVQTIVVTHSDVYNILMQAGFDENFWEGIELA